MKRFILTIACLAMTVATAIQVQAGVMTFTTASASGQFGPNQGMLDAEYAGSNLDGLVTATGSGVQVWTVQNTGSYRITAAGAQGASGDASYLGGKGALISGDFFFTAGDVLQIAVGQLGVGQSSGSNGGGGGGSFVVDAIGNPLLVAGGGGGTRTSVLQNGHDGQVSNFGTTASGSSQTGGGVLKTSALGLGGLVSSSSYGSAGAGFFGNGANDGNRGFGGSSWSNGLIGGAGNSVSGVEAFGGFGGGGAGNGSWGGGGGGGYSGGDGGRVAGGGGSFNLGTNAMGIAGFNSGDGYVTVESLSVAPVPEPASLAIFGIGALGLVASRRRRKVKVDLV